MPLLSHHLNPVTEIQNGLPFWCHLTQVLLEKKLLNRVSWCLFILSSLTPSSVTLMYP